MQLCRIRLATKYIQSSASSTHVILNHVDDEHRFTPAALVFGRFRAKREYVERFFRTFTLKLRPEFGRDCLTCAMFAQLRNGDLLAVFARAPPPSEYGTYKTVKARFWPLPPGKGP